MRLQYLTPYLMSFFVLLVRSTGVSPATDSPSLSSETEILLKPTELDLPGE